MQNQKAMGWNTPIITLLTAILSSSLVINGIIMVRLRLYIMREINKDYNKKYINEIQYESLINTVYNYIDIIKNSVWIKSVHLGSNDIIIFGHNFGNIPGLVFINETRFAHIQWTNTRIDIEKTTLLKDGSTITIINNEGIEASVKYPIRT